MNGFDLPGMRAILQGEFGLAYVQAVAAAAGYGVDKAGAVQDADGVDLLVVARGVRGIRRNPQMNVQVKTTAGALVADPFPIDLPVKNYEELRDETLQVPRVLVAVIVPDDPADWLAHSEAELVMRRCGYWLSLTGQPPTSNAKKIRVHIPRAQVFDVAQLQALMGSVALGEAR